MERISRALELARTQRESRGQEHDVVAGLRPLSLDSPTPDVAIAGGVADRLEKRAPFEPGDTLVHRLPVIELDPQRRERERILQPGCPGPIGAPYKMLRSQVLKRLDHLGVNSLAIVADTAGAGKTLTAINLSIAIAADPGRSVLLVDLDLRNPGIAKRLGLQLETGVEDCLADGLPIHRAMCKLAGYERLTVLGARQRVEHSSDLLRSQRVADAVLEMRNRYANRVLIFDLPPVLQCDDALAFSKHVQAGLVVVGEGRTRRDDVARTIELLRDLTIVGTVLNGSREPADTHY